jgi:tRNA(adenine34) deaminase
VFVLGVPLGEWDLQDGNRRCNPMLFCSAMTEMAPADVAYMRAAIEQAQAAGARGEVPVGAVIVSDDHIVGLGGNRTILDCDPSAHAEIVAMREAAKTIGNYRLLGTTLYATIEPCAMCAGAMVQARIARLVYGAQDPKGGAVHSCFSIFDHPQINHRVKVVGGLLAEDAAALLQNFFAGRR